jgi:protein-L-isoaspartate(D-aspartate) O-methyltransferase
VFGIDEFLHGGGRVRLLVPGFLVHGSTLRVAGARRCRVPYAASRRRQLFRAARYRNVDAPMTWWHARYLALDVRQTNAMIDFGRARQQMVERQIAGRGLHDPVVLSAMRRVPREAFVPEAMRDAAYDDGPLPIGEGQTISQPYVVALMAEAAGVDRRDRVLEVGTGSGYAAAVLGEMAASVDTIERHHPLAERARDVLRRLHYRNVTVHEGDGTLGWAQGAPYDVILASAGGPDVPEAWCEQLAVGGRLVMPVGMSRDRQQLVRIVRRGEHDYDEQRLGAVQFVPLIGVQGWRDTATGSSAASNDANGAVIHRPMTPGRRIAEAAEVLPEIDDAAFGSVIDRFADKRVVLIGDATHGTSEFYRARAALTRRLIDAHGFDIVAIEGDWPDASAVDRQVRGLPPRKAMETPFARFPMWMWRNVEVADFLAWMRQHNLKQPPTRRALFCGLDMYSLSASMAAVLAYLEQVDPDAAKAARNRYGCMEPWREDPQVYGRWALDEDFKRCEDAVVSQWKELLAKRTAYTEQGNDEPYFDAAQNARLVANAERYYRALYYGATESWNLRDTHMADTLQHVLEARGPMSKAVVWAHNSHIGDARATESGSERHRLNLGQLCRERWGDAVAAIGMATHTGTVACASHWGADMEIKRILPSHEESYEAWLHASGVPRFLLDLRPQAHPLLHEQLLGRRLQRYIGVIYRPESELHSHYLEASLPGQYDAFLWFDETLPVTPLQIEQGKGSADTFPTGL